MNIKRIQAPCICATCDYYTPLSATSGRCRIAGTKVTYPIFAICEPSAYKVSRKITTQIKAMQLDEVKGEPK
jgi:hypothetical protein